MSTRRLVGLLLTGPRELRVLLTGTTLREEEEEATLLMVEMVAAGVPYSSYPQLPWKLTQPLQIP